MELTAVPATQFSSVQLTDILNACFEAYLVPVYPVGRGICSAFLAPEGMSLVDSRVWLAGDEPAAIRDRRAPGECRSPGGLCPAPGLARQKAWAGN
ncbi:N-acetyltransferase GCN5 [Klebsiella pneumoniae]|uniref:N-acetyltransferase GCN5 n=1 Tax=Klebsiella pneumoniae TaxID=573 RepID=A0A447RYN2_KLEPN|nr:N-acetyltransferase GCN5 [Klebsiella pneumoniae]